MLADIPAGKALGDAAAAPARRRGAAAGSIKQRSDLPPATEDVPASTYARLERSVILWLLGDNILLTFACVGKKSVRMPCMLMEMLVFQISISLCMLLFWYFGLFRRRQACARHLGQFYDLPGYIFVHWPFGAWVSPFAGSDVIPMDHVLLRRLWMAHENPPRRATRPRLLGADPHQAFTRGRDIPGRALGHRRHARDR